MFNFLNQKEENLANIDVDAQVRIKRNRLAKRFTLRLNHKDRCVDLIMPIRGSQKQAERFIQEQSFWIEEKLKTVKFKGVNWDLTIQPTQQNLKDLSYFAGVMGSVESTFVAKTDGADLKFYIGDGSNDRVEIPFASNVNAELKKGWAWPLAQTLSILKLSDTSNASISFSEQGAMKISIDSGIGLYDYILPARTSA